MDIIKEYTDPSKPGSFSSKSSFIRELKKRHKKLDKNIINKIDEELSNLDAYTLHRSARKKFLRNKILNKIKCLKN